MKKLLLITRHRLNENNGGANASKGFVSCFETLFDDCTLIYPAFDGDTTLISPKWKRCPCHDHRSRIRKGLDCYRGIISPIPAFAKKHLKTHHYDLVVIDHSFIGHTLAQAVKNTGAQLITIHHNVERDYQHDNRKDYSIAFRLPYLHYARKAERECLLYSDLNLTLTPQDAATFYTWYPHRNLHLHHWGVFRKDLSLREGMGVGSGYVITGSLNFSQSIEPIIAFVSRYWPVVRTIQPDARLTIAGRDPADTLLAACRQQQGITVVPNPDDISEVVRQVRYYICPINAGSGLKLRIMDGLSQGLPVLCHERAAAGYQDIREAGYLFTYRDEATFADALRTMTATPVQPQAVRQAYIDTFSIDSGIRRLRSILENTPLALPSS